MVEIFEIFQINRSIIYFTVYPSFSKIPQDIRITAGSTASLECSAEGLPTPQIAWQKDGGNDFPAARERRMHKMPTDDVLFIIDVKTADSGVYSCTAQNLAGMIVANASLTILGNYSDIFYFHRLIVCSSIYIQRNPCFTNLF